MNWHKEGCDLIYFKFVPINKMAIFIESDRKIDWGIPIFSIVKKEDIKLETFVDDLIQAGLVEKV